MYVIKIIVNSKDEHSYFGTSWADVNGYFDQGRMMNFNMAIHVMFVNSYL